VKLHARRVAERPAYVTGPQGCHAGVGRAGRATYACVASGGLTPGGLAQSHRWCGQGAGAGD
jgi:hypothetical protein